MNPELEGVVRQELEARGFELFDLRTGGTRNRPVLEVRIDRQDGGTVTIDDCAVASRAIEARLDGSDLVSDRYRLDVSSPGIERPLRGPRDWRRFVGKRATVTAQALPGGKAEVEIIGVEGEPGTEVGVVRDARGTEHRIALADVTQARLAFHW